MVMDEDPYASPAARIDSAAALSTRPVLYARVGIRFRALLIDSFVLILGYVLVSVLGVALHHIPIAGPVLLGSWVLLALLYEPVLVSQTGGTIGHHLKNICVVSDRTGGRPGIFAALVRSLTKAMLGWLSFLAILASDRQQALHDSIVGVTVRIKDEKRARRRDYVRVA